MPLASADRFVLAGQEPPNTDESPGHHGLAPLVPDLTFTATRAKSGWIPTTLTGEIASPSPRDGSSSEPGGSCWAARALNQPLAS